MIRQRPAAPRLADIAPFHVVELLTRALVGAQTLGEALDRLGRFLHVLLPDMSVKVDVRGTLATLVINRKLEERAREGGSFLAAHNLAAFHQSLGQAQQAAQWRERAQAWRAAAAPLRPSAG